MAVNFKTKNKRQLNIAKAFFKFLKERGIYDKFIEYNEKAKLHDPITFSIGLGFYLIGDAFQWSNTEEGIMFWSGVSNEWIRYFDANKEKILQ